MDARGGLFHSLRLVTANYHMPRSLLEFARAMPDIEIVPHPVFPEISRGPHWWAAAGEFRRWCWTSTTNISSRWRGRPAASPPRSEAARDPAALAPVPAPVLSPHRGHGGARACRCCCCRAPGRCATAPRGRGRCWRCSKRCVGLGYEVRGRDHLPEGAVAHRHEASIGLGHVRGAGDLRATGHRHEARARLDSDLWLVRAQGRDDPDRPRRRARERCARWSRRRRRQWRQGGRSSSSPKARAPPSARRPSYQPGVYRALSPAPPAAWCRWR